MEAGVINRALNHHWPPGSWAQLTMPQLMRIYAVEQQVIDQRQPEVSPADPLPIGNPPIGSDGDV